MTSDESDDEPLSVLAANKKSNPEQFEDAVPQTSVVPKKKKRKIAPPKRLAITIKLQKNRARPPPVIERPADVWLYLKDLNPAGPYSCLLCSEWFINRSKLICHYVLNHKKDFCGICRYFVPDRESWLRHIKFHTPWPCSQCIQNFDTEVNLRDHLRTVHNLVHCRLCHFRVLDGDPYHTHLLKKHNVTNVANINADSLWEQDGTSSFLCLLCSKANNLSRTFFTHFMGLHHFTLKCFTGMLSGRDPPFTVAGADLRPEFIEEQLKTHSRYGYVDSESKPPNVPFESDQSDTKDLLKALIPEIKQEVINNDESDNENKDNSETEKAKKDKLEEIYKNYNGDIDFDVTVIELIIIQKCYYDYICDILSDINAKSVYEFSDIDYEKMVTDTKNDVLCILCNNQYNNILSFTIHMVKMHCVKSLPLFSCRICAATFDSQPELDNHTVNELGDFEDLWICQFCEKEFDDREATRRHLNEHWELLEYDNCFSPHLGFKCRYCPTLFWHETDRETHQLRTHFFHHKESYYKCETCGDVFSDKVWFIHHYLEKHSAPNNVPVYLLKCTLCCIVLPTVEQMRAHFKTEHPEAKKVFCSLDPCKYKPLSHRKSFKLHVRTIHCSRGRRDRVVECTVCGREFTSTRACSAHMAQAHGHTTPGKFKCKLCGDLLHTMDERKLHYLLRHPGQHPFECNECGKSFQYKSSLYMHKQEHQPNKEKFTCTYCGKIFMKKDSYREHIQIHEGPRHACSYCPMRFVQRSNMLRHERRHTGERPYACPHCPRSFADKGACNSHARTHSKSTSYACMYCGKTFVQKSKLTYHIRKHTGENLETCSVCSKLFTSACSLREHMKIHEPKKALIKCPLCDRKYQDERYMLRHLRTSHTRARHPCPLCDKMLTSAAGLRHHVMTHSNLKTLRCKICPKAYAVKRTMMRHFRRRHGFKGTEPNIKEFYTRLDPRECNLGLDETMMTSIFGPPRSSADEVIVSDFVTLSNLEQQRIMAERLQMENRQNTQEVQNEQPRDENEKSRDNETCPNSEGVNKITIKVEPKDDSDQELEPTDFVSVKIEPMDDDAA